MSSIHLIKQLKEEKAEKQKTQNLNLKTETQNAIPEAVEHVVNIWNGLFVKSRRTLKYLSHKENEKPLQWKTQTSDKPF